MLSLGVLASTDCQITCCHKGYPVDVHWSVLVHASPILVVIHPQESQLSHDGFPMDGALVGSGLPSP